MKASHLLAVLFCLVSISFASFVWAAEDYSAPFSEHFDGSKMDIAKWETYEQNINMTPYPAYGGSIQVADGNLRLSSNGSTFPFIQTLQNPFPATGDFAIQFNVTYSTIGDRGCGLMIGNGTPYMTIGPFGEDVWHNRVFTLWAADKGTTQAMIYIELFNRFVYEMDYAGFKPSSPSHLYKLAFVEGVYHVYVDNVEVANVSSDIRPSTIIVGHPPVPRLPIPPDSTLPIPPVSTVDWFGWSDWGWSRFEVDYIALLKSSQISLSATPQANVGNRVTISGSLSGANGEPLSDKHIELLYTIPGMSSWYPLAAATTDVYGLFSAIWIPSANGEFRLKAVWSGDEAYSGASSDKNVSILSGEETTEFFVESNSTLSSLSFNSTSKEISFTVSGPNGTGGYVKFVIPKTLLPTLEDFKVYMDEQEVSFAVTSDGDSYVLSFEYHHSVHEVTMRIPTLTTPEFPSWVLMPLLFCLVVVAFAAKKNLVLSR